MPLFEVDAERPVLVHPTPTTGGFGTAAQRVVDGNLDGLLGEQIFPVSQARSQDEPHLLALDAAGLPVVIDVVSELTEETLTRALNHAGAAGQLTRAELAARYPRGATAFHQDVAAFYDNVPLTRAQGTRTTGARLIVICQEAAEGVLDALDFLRQPGSPVAVLRLTVLKTPDGRRFVDVSPLAVSREHRPVARARAQLADNTDFVEGIAVGRALTGKVSVVSREPRPESRRSPEDERSASVDTAAPPEAPGAHLGADRSDEGPARSRAARSGANTRAAHSGATPTATAGSGATPTAHSGATPTARSGAAGMGAAPSGATPAVDLGAAGMGAHSGAAADRAAPSGATPVMGSGAIPAAQAPGTPTSSRPPLRSRADRRRAQEQAAEASAALAAQPVGGGPGGTETTMSLPPTPPAPPASGPLSMVPPPPVVPSPVVPAPPQTSEVPPPPPGVGPVPAPGSPVAGPPVAGPSPLADPVPVASPPLAGPPSASSAPTPVTPIPQWSTGGSDPAPATGGVTAESIPFDDTVGDVVALAGSRVRPPANVVSPERGYVGGPGGSGPVPLSGSVVGGPGTASGREGLAGGAASAGSAEATPPDRADSARPGHSRGDERDPMARPDLSGDDLADEDDPDLIALARSIGSPATLVWSRPRRGQRYEATLLPDGYIVLVDGSRFRHPDLAAHAVSGTQSADGWSVWRFGDDGPTLTDAFRARNS